VLDTATRELVRAGAASALSPKAFALLALLAERRPAAVSHAELREALWPGMEAGGTTLARLVNEVRAAVGDRAEDARVIRTVARFGYAFCAEATDATDASGGEGGAPRVVCALQWGDRHFPLPPGAHVIGRAPDARVTVPASNVSRHHARIVVTADGATIEDLGSRNGTFVGGGRISAATVLKNDDRIAVGPATLVFCQADDDATTSA
jgi:DNA-binding winged helix-turn-helix (wHTH) protein